MYKIYAQLLLSLLSVFPVNEINQSFVFLIVKTKLYFFLGVNIAFFIYSY